MMLNHDFDGEYALAMVNATLASMVAVVELIVAAIASNRWDTVQFRKKQ